MKNENSQRKIYDEEENNFFYAPNNPNVLGKTAPIHSAEPFSSFGQPKFSPDRDTKESKTKLNVKEYFNTHASLKKENFDHFLTFIGLKDIWKTKEEQKILWDSIVRNASDKNKIDYQATLKRICELFEEDSDSGGSNKEEIKIKIDLSDKDKKEIIVEDFLNGLVGNNNANYNYFSNMSVLYDIKFINVLFLNKYLNDNNKNSEVNNENKNEKGYEVKVDSIIDEIKKKYKFIKIQEEDIKNYFIFLESLSSKQNNSNSFEDNRHLNVFISKEVPSLINEIIDSKFLQPNTIINNLSINNDSHNNSGSFSHSNIDLSNNNTINNNKTSFLIAQNIEKYLEKLDYLDTIISLSMETIINLNYNKDFLLLMKDFIQNFVLLSKKNIYKDIKSNEENKKLISNLERDNKHLRKKIKKIIMSVSKNESLAKDNLELKSNSNNENNTTYNTNSNIDITTSDLRKSLSHSKDKKKCRNRNKTYVNTKKQQLKSIKEDMRRIYSYPEKTQVKNKFFQLDNTNNNISKDSKDNNSKIPDLKKSNNDLNKISIIESRNDIEDDDMNNNSKLDKLTLYMNDDVNIAETPKLAKKKDYTYEQVGTVSLNSEDKPEEEYNYNDLDDSGDNMNIIGIGINMHMNRGPTINTNDITSIDRESNLNSTNEEIKNIQDINTSEFKESDNITNTCNNTNNYLTKSLPQCQDPNNFTFGSHNNGASSKKCVNSIIGNNNEESNQNKTKNNVQRKKNKSGHYDFKYFYKNIYIRKLLFHNNEALIPKEFFSDEITLISKLKRQKCFMIISSKSFYIIKADEEFSLLNRIELENIESVTISSKNFNLILFSFIDMTDLVVETFRRIELLKFLKEIFATKNFTIQINQNNNNNNTYDNTNKISNSDLNNNNISKSNINNSSSLINSKKDNIINSNGGKLKVLTNQNFTIRKKNGTSETITIKKNKLFIITPHFENAQKVGTLLKYQDNFFSSTFQQKFLVLCSVGLMCFDEPDKSPKLIIPVVGTSLKFAVVPGSDKLYCFHMRTINNDLYIFGSRIKDEIFDWVDELIVYKKMYQKKMKEIDPDITFQTKYIVGLNK